MHFCFLEPVRVVNQQGGAPVKKSTHRRWIYALMIMLCTMIFMPDDARATLNPDATDFVICNACSSAQRLNAATAAIPLDGNDWTIVVLDENTYTTFSYSGFREYDWELRRTLSSVYEMSNDVDAIEMVTALKKMKTNLDAIRLRADPGSVWTVDGVSPSTVPLGSRPVVIPVVINGVDTSSAARLNQGDGESVRQAISWYVTTTRGNNVLMSSRLINVFKKLLGKALKNVTVVFSDGSTLTLKYTGEEINPNLQWEPLFETIQGVPSSGGSGSGGGGGDPISGGGGGGGGGGLQIGTTCISGTVRDGAGIALSSSFICFNTLTP
jgi:hypothetical protein